MSNEHPDFTAQHRAIALAAAADVFRLHHPTAQELVEYADVLRVYLDSGDVAE